ncbi:MAG: glycine zipper 2TM domain-containing protein [Sulfuriflexus sp.]|nr:glycine zipper 2TM domain-containing protein [Sulfuriflexus sp.]
MRTSVSIPSFLTLLFISLALGSNPALADPPSHAPAHGYYKDKGKGKHKKKKHRETYNEGYREPQHTRYEPLSCDPGGITNSDIGTVVGGVIGGILGSKIGKGSGKTLATIAGVIVGANIGGSIGSSMDEADRYCAGQAFVHAKDNQAVAWTNPDTRQQYTMTPQRSYTRDNGRSCRDYTSSVLVNGQRDEVTGTACKDGNGNWQIIN